MAPRKQVSKGNTASTEKAQDKGKKRKATDDNTSTSQKQKRSKASGSKTTAASTSKTPAAGSRRTSVMTEEEDTALHQDATIHVSDSDAPQDSEDESSEAELGKPFKFLLAELTLLHDNRTPTKKVDLPYLCIFRAHTRH
jgi:hypothetical protein